jgi:hypothetical protein
LISLKNTTFEPVVKNYNFEDLSSRYSFVHIQHNIGPMSYEFDHPVFHQEVALNGTLYTNPVKNKMSPNDETRTISNYLIHTKQFQYPSADLYTLQEVQEQNKEYVNSEIYVNSETYGYVYKKTGHLVFAKENSTFPINHGCAVVYNTKRFRLVSTVSHYFNDRIYTRSTPWVVLEDKITTKKYAVLSLHGTIASDFKNATKAIDIYNSLKREISTYFTNSSINIIIGSDLNINIFTPNLNPFNKLQSQKDIDSLNQLQFETQSLLQFMKERGISSVTDGTTATNYSYHSPNSFEESLDFIFNSNLYITDVLMSNLHRGSLLDIQNRLQQLKDDFDHSMLIVTCLDKDIKENLNLHR